MLDASREELYLEDLKAALQEYQQVNKELERVMTERQKRIRLVKSLLSVMKIQVGDSRTRDLIEKANLTEAVRPFFTIETLHTAGARTVVRRRRGEKQAVDPATVLAKGTPVKILTGTYTGYTGVVASTMAKQTRRGLDVTYFLALTGPKGDRRRTSVKHGTLNKSWAVVTPES